ncbi:MAG: nitroreductase family protein, partial [Flavobacteriales bacterium]
TNDTTDENNENFTVLLSKTDNASIGTKSAKVQIDGIKKTTYREVRQSDMRIVAHKSTALAAQSFMLSMAAKGYDTCPMEGFDSKRLKQVLSLPATVEINMVVSCGIRKEEGIYGERFRVPFEKVYHKH